MEKANAVAELGASSLLMPAWIKAALGANDRLKLYLTLLQAAADHAAHPDKAALDLRREMNAAGVSDEWLHDLPASASLAGDALFLADLEKLAECLAEDLLVMAKPLLNAPEEASAFETRVAHWHNWLLAVKGERLSREGLHDLTRGHHGEDDSLHVLVMDLHKRLNHLAAALASDLIDGAHVWQINDDDRPLVAAFMQGLNRTAPLKLDHPGLDTAATRDGARLLIQNDIGTNDAHVLVVQVEALTVTLTYSDLHRARFSFFQAVLAELGAQWSVVDSHVSDSLNRGEAYFVGTATFACADVDALARVLEGIGSKVVFLIDWNRARKRLQMLVDKNLALAVLTESARQEIGHRAWLEAGAQDMVFTAMQAQGGGAFRLGDQLEDVLGESEARAFLVDVLKLCNQAALRGQPYALAADETRLRLARQMQRRTAEFDALSEHAAWCHALAQGVRDALAHGRESEHKVIEELAAKAKTWERRADELVMFAREQALRQPRWKPFEHLLELSDDVADALEECAFMMSLMSGEHRKGLGHDVRQVLLALADTLLGAVQDHVRALAVARTLGEGSDAADHEAFLAATWSVLRAERQCDELLRSARRVIFSKLDHAADLMLANDLAMTLELASDRLLSVAYALRDVAFARVEAAA